MHIDYTKGNGLVPVIIQHNLTSEVLMLGYMNEEAYKKTIVENRVTFYSRSKNRLWTKGEVSGNFLEMVSIHLDCDQDTLLIKVLPSGPTCHTGSSNCFRTISTKGFLYQLENTIQKRIDDAAASSYTYQLFKKGINKVAQKVGEEAVEVVIESKDQNDDLFQNECADLLYHFLILLKAKNQTLEDIEKVLWLRSKPNN